MRDKIDEKIKEAIKSFSENEDDIRRMFQVKADQIDPWDEVIITELMGVYLFESPLISREEISDDRLVKDLNPIADYVSAAEFESFQSKFFEFFQVKSVPMHFESIYRLFKGNHYFNEDKVVSRRAMFLGLLSSLSMENPPIFELQDYVIGYCRLVFDSFKPTKWHVYDILISMWLAFRQVCEHIRGSKKWFHFKKSDMYPIIKGISEDVKQAIAEYLNISDNPTTVRVREAIVNGKRLYYPNRQQRREAGVEFGARTRTRGRRSDRAKFRSMSSKEIRKMKRRNKNVKR